MPVKPKGFRKAAKKVLKAVGGDVTIRKITAGAYNTATGAVGESASDTVVKGFVEGVATREVGELIKANDKRLTIAASDLDSFRPRFIASQGAQSSFNPSNF